MFRWLSAPLRQQKTAFQALFLYRHAEMQNTHFVWIMVYITDIRSGRKTGSVAHVLPG